MRGIGSPYFDRIEIDRMTVMENGRISYSANVHSRHDLDTDFSRIHYGRILKLAEIFGTGLEFDRILSLSLGISIFNSFSCNSLVFSFIVLYKVGQLSHSIRIRVTRGIDIF
jgi:hypothetical protein